MVRQHSLRRSGELPSRHPGGGDIPLLPFIRAVVDGHTVDLRASPLRETRLPLEVDALAGSGAASLVERGEVLQLGDCRVFDDHYRP